VLMQNAGRVIAVNTLAVETFARIDGTNAAAAAGNYLLAALTGYQITIGFPEAPSEDDGLSLGSMRMYGDVRWSERRVPVHPRPRCKAEVGQSSRSGLTKSPGWVRYSGAQNTTERDTLAERVLWTGRLVQPSRARVVAA
jgi:hypothetical protein